MEVPVALQTAIALPRSTVSKSTSPDQVLVADEGVTGNCGRILGTKIRINGVVASSSGGRQRRVKEDLDLNEDVEGNVNLGPKKALMDKLGLLPCPRFSSKARFAPIQPSS